MDGTLIRRDQKSEIGNRKEMGNQTNTRKSFAKDLMSTKLHTAGNGGFHADKDFPSEEKYALTSQIRRSSRSVCLNLREAWAKRRYQAHFVSKLTDCDGENSETDSSLDFARDCGYVSPRQHTRLTTAFAEIGRMLGAMMKKSESFMTPFI